MRLPLSSRSKQRPVDHIGEVITASTTTYTAQCFEPDDLTFPSMPALGSWVKSRDEETGNLIYGVVFQAAIAPIDTVHRARALGLTAAELREQQPQIFAMLKTDFQVAIVGFEPELDPIPASTRRFHQYLPPRPPQIHQGVYWCSVEEVTQFCQHTEFLRTLLQVTGIPTDELLAAVIRGCYKMLNFDQTWLVQVGRHLSILLKDDYDRLSAIIRKLAM